MLELVLLDGAFQEVLRQEIQKFEDCYDAAVQLQNGYTYGVAYVGSCSC